MSKSVFFILIFNWVLFSIIGFILFPEDETSKDFMTVWISFENMFLLLVACNFPDIMINLFDKPETKYLAIIFFLSYIIISFFLVQGLLKALYYSNYSEILKNQHEEYKKKR